MLPTPEVWKPCFIPHDAHTCISRCPQGTLCLGFVTPLYLAYMLEAREKLAFVRRRLLSESEREVGAEAAAARARLWRQENPKNPFACCMLYFSLLFIANVFIFLILAHVQLSMAR